MWSERRDKGRVGADEGDTGGDRIKGRLPQRGADDIREGLDDSTLLVADNYMDKGARNLEENPQVAVSVWDTETKQAYQIKGTAEILRSGPAFDETVAWVTGLKPHLTTKAAILLRVAHVYVCQPRPDLGKDVVLR